MSRTQRGQLIATACVCAMAITAGFTDLMVSEASTLNNQPPDISQQYNYTQPYPIWSIPTTYPVTAMSGNVVIYCDQKNNEMVGTGSSTHKLHSFSSAQACNDQANADGLASQEMYANANN